MKYPSKCLSEENLKKKKLRPVVHQSEQTLFNLKPMIFQCADSATSVSNANMSNADEMAFEDGDDDQKDGDNNR